ncbi:predicted protein [Naegleria gruberi]|uniref:Predicted protein n=1 Tax=Naegleria gruberi TaxID=5762 RepID=D2V6C0_NAEGR|nr:uncharacterized protein NAEGRDRAFT_31574 [Naegleria gruberi]EFC47543.1 predicted protein [Naegleria gruberi]|eukprot:XP_002680287.1 predicted protein [Naegleria gruberi strain NEG-M]
MNLGGATNKQEIPAHFDYIVIGGGSGGLSLSKQLSSLSSKETRICLLDYRDPSSQWLRERNGKLNGWMWQLGGTCVNVGCIPKKLMHNSALIGEGINHDAEYFGWNDGKQEGKLSGKHDWKTLVANVQQYIKSLNFGYRTSVTQTYAFDNEDPSLKKLYYLNMKGRFVDDHTLELTDPRKGITKTISGKVIILSVGGTPNIPQDVPGATEYAITSDDIFSLKEEPGKTLVIGASYIALETASFLKGLGYESSVMMRSIPLRGFDQECAWKVVDGMKERGVKFLEQCIPVKIEKSSDHETTGEYTVHYKDLSTQQVYTENYKTIMFAVGRRAVTKELNIDLDMDESGKIIVSDNEQTSKKHIYAIGDCINKKTELTPVAIRAGKLLASRLTNKGTELMDYDNVPTSIFTHPYEYGCCGLSEEEAVQRYGEDDIEVYISLYSPIEHQLSHRDTNKTFMKIITLKSANEKVIGFHYVGANAGEITQGIAVAIKAGATKEHFDNTIGIHPTAAEEMTLLSITKRSGNSAEKDGC